MQVLIQNIIFLSTILLASAQQQPSNQSQNPPLILTYIPITQYGVTNHWDSIYSSLKQQPIPDQIKILDNIVSIEGLDKLFNSDALDNIKKFTIKNTIINEPIMKYLLNQSKFYQFQKITLSSCNLMTDDFSSIISRKTKIKSLILDFNRLSTQAFKSLSKLQMNLSELSIDGSSLIQDQAVQALISIGLSNVEKLFLTSTAISGDNLLKVLRSLNTSKLIRLDIGKNDFPLSFYREFSKFKFDQLNVLDLMNLQIDEDGFQYLNNMKFPKMYSLVLDNNQLTTQMSYKFITKQRFPLLTRLAINYNFLNSSFFTHLKKQGFVLTALMCYIPKMDLKGLKQISSLDLTLMQTIIYSARATTPQIAKQFLQTINEKAQNLQILDLSDVSDKGDYVQYILNRRWPKLQKLNLDDIGQIDQDIYLDQQPIFPQLRNLVVQIQRFKTKELSHLIKNIQKIAPKIQEIVVDSQIIAQLIGELFSQNIKNSLTNQFTLRLRGQFPTSGSFQVILDPVQKPAIITLNLQFLFVNYLLSKGLGSIVDVISGNGQIDIDPDQLDIQQLLDLQNQINKYQQELHKNFDLKKLQFLHETDKLNFIKTLLVRNNRKYVFENLKKIHIKISQNTQIQQIKYCQFPSLKVLAIQDAGIDQQSQVTLDFATNKFSYISQFLMNLQLPIQTIHRFFKLNNFTYLVEFSLSSISNLQSSDIAQIQAQIPYFNRIHQIDYSSAFLHKDLTFLANSGIQPQRLVLNQILFNNGVFQQLQIVITNCGIDDNAMVQWLNCIKKKTNASQGYIYFPKLQGISLQNNYIGTAGFSSFMSMGLPSLKQVGFNRNMDSQLFNSIFKSQWSKRIQIFSSTYKKFYGIDGTLNPRNTRRIKQFGIETASLMDTDIQALAKYQLPSLQLINLKIGKIQNCIFLQNLANFFKTAINIQLIIDDSPMLNSTCMVNTQQYPSISPQGLIIKGSEYYGEIQRFTDKLINKNSQLKTIVLLNNYASQAKLIELFSTSDLSNLTQVVLGPDQVTDQLCNLLFKFNPQQIQVLALPGNYITSKGLESLNNINFTNLQVLDLGNTNIGDEGIKYLIRNNFPRLRVLILRNTDITKQGILELNKLKAKNLMLIDLSCNDLKFDDLAVFKTSGFLYLANVLLYPTMKKSQYDQLMKIFQKKKSFFSLPVAIMTTQIQILEYQLEEDAYFDDQEDLHITA